MTLPPIDLKISRFSFKAGKKQLHQNCPAWRHGGDPKEEGKTQARFPTTGFLQFYIMSRVGAPIRRERRPDRVGRSSWILAFTLNSTLLELKSGIGGFNFQWSFPRGNTHDQLAPLLHTSWCPSSKKREPQQSWGVPLNGGAMVLGRGGNRPLKGTEHLGIAWSTPPPSSYTELTWWSLR